MIRDVASLYSYRQFILNTAFTQFRYRYGGTYLGNFWNFAGPLALVTIFSIVFSRIMPVRVAGLDPNQGFVLYLCSGMMLWLSFVDALVRSANSLLENSQYIRKLAIPEIAFVGQAAASSLILAAISVGIVVVLSLILGRVPSLAWLTLVPTAMLTVAFAASIGLILAPLVVIVRDILQALPIITQVWMWLTPIVYVSATLPEGFRRVIGYNPVTIFVESFRNAILHDAAPGLRDWLSMIVCVAITFALALVVLGRLKGEVRDGL